MFARWISCEEKTATARDRVDENSGVNRVVAPNRSIRDKEKTSEFILSHMYLFISVTLDRKRKKKLKRKPKMENGSTVMMTETNRS